MGYNRPGNARKKRLRRAKKHNERLALKAEKAADKGVLTKVKEAAVSAAGAVADAAGAVVKAVRGKK